MGQGGAPTPGHRGPEASGRPRDPRVRARRRAHRQAVGAAARRHRDCRRADVAAHGQGYPVERLGQVRRDPLGQIAVQLVEAATKQRRRSDSGSRRRWHWPEATTRSGSLATSSAPCGWIEPARWICSRSQLDRSACPKPGGADGREATYEPSRGSTASVRSVMLGCHPDRSGPAWRINSAGSSPEPRLPRCDYRV